jgi:hypothetical protein
MFLCSFLSIEMWHKTAEWYQHIASYNKYTVKRKKMNDDTLLFVLWKYLKKKWRRIKISGWFHFGGTKNRMLEKFIFESMKTYKQIGQLFPPHIWHILIKKHCRTYGSITYYSCFYLETFYIIISFFAILIYAFPGKWKKMRFYIIRTSCKTNIIRKTFARSMVCVVMYV